MPEPVKIDYTTEAGRPLAIKITAVDGRPYEFTASLSVADVVDTGRRTAEGLTEFGFFFQILVQRKKDLP